MALSILAIFTLLVCPKSLIAQEENFDITLPAAPIAFYLKSLANSELGVAKLQETLTAAAKKQKIDQKILSDLSLENVAEKLATKWNTLRDHLSNVSLKLEAKLRSSGLSTHKSQILPPPCCATQDSKVDKGCSVIHLGYNGTRTARIAAEIFASSVSPVGSKRQFFISTDRTTHLEFPASRACGTRAYNWHRESFVQTVSPHRKHALIILDRGSAISTLFLDIGRSIAGYIIESLQVPDQVALLTIDSSRINIAANQGCGSWAIASSLTKKVVHSHLSSINRMSYQRYDHTVALQKAEDLIQDVSGDNISVFYITTAKSLQNVEKFLDSYQKLQEGQSEGSVNLKIFLMEQQHSSQADLLLAQVSTLCRTKGICISTKTVDSTLLLSYKIGPLFDYVETFHQEGALSQPWIDELQSTEPLLVVTRTHKIKSSDNTTQAVIGLDVDYQYLFEDIFYRNIDDQPHFCVLHATTRTVMYHPMISYGSAQDHFFPQGLAFTQLESEIDSEKEEHIFNQMTGSFRIRAKSYRWKHVQKEFIIVAIEEQNQSAFSSSGLSVVPIPKSFDVSAVFHRLDILPPQYQMKLCRHLLKPATIETGSVFLSPKSTNSHGQLQAGNLDAEEILSIMQYLTKAQTDDINSAIKLDLKTGIREELQTLAYSILPVWKNMSFTSGMNNYIVRRFAATSDGLLLSYPGSPLPDGLDPQRQEWYLTAKRFPDKVVVTRPRLDHGGAGYVLTISQHVPTANVVIAMDLTLGYFQKMVDWNMPTNMLNQEGVRYFIFDHEGYLIIHPSQFDRSQTDIEGLHLTHVEHLAVSLMLEDKTLVHRHHCKRFADMTIQRYYSFNTSASSAPKAKVWQNNDLDCFQYKVSMLKNTNLFLAVLLTNASSRCSRDDVTFCPHNPSGSCILCGDDNDIDGRDQHQCESPCQCPLRQCSEAKNSEICPTEPQIPPKPDNMMENLSLPSCFDRNCKKHKSRSKCTGVIGCAWCEFELNGQEAFCSEEAKCFGGVWGSRWPYDHERGAKLIEDDYFFRKTPSLAPIAGSVLSVILFLGISAYCIRNYNKCLRQPTTRVVRRHNRSGSILQAASFEEVLEEQNQDELHELSNKNEAAIVSPYRINPGYRRPLTATDSDHGYSTMTPMGDLDSEIIPYVASVPSRHRLQRLQQRQHGVPSVTSGVSSGTSSPTPKKGLLPLTSTTPSSSEDSSPVARGTTCQAMTSSTTSLEQPILPKNTVVSAQSGSNSNQFLVAATVHMVDTT